MMDDDTSPGDFVFRKGADGNLEFVGDFETLCQTEEDPWDQSAGDSDMAAYYPHPSQKRTSSITPFIVH